MGSSSRRPHRVPLLSAKNRKTEDTNHTPTHPKLDNRRLEKTLPGLMSLDFCCDIQMESEFGVKNPSCLVSTVQAAGGGVMVWGIFSWHTLGLLVPIEHCLNTTADLSIVADHVHPFRTTVYPSSDGYFQQG